MSSANAVNTVVGVASVVPTTGAPASPTLEELPPPEVTLLRGSNLHEKLAGTLFMLASSQRDAAREAKKAASAAADAAARTKIDEMRAKADHDLASGLVSGGLQLAGAGLSIGATQLPRECSSIAKVVRDGGETWSRVGDAAGKAAGASLTFTASRFEQDGNEEQLAADRARTAAEEHGELEREAADTLKRALDLYKELTAAKDDTHRAALHRA